MCGEVSMRENFLNQKLHIANMLTKGKKLFHFQSYDIGSYDFLIHMYEQRVSVVLHRISDGIYFTVE